MEMLVEWDGTGATLKTGIDKTGDLVRITPGGNWSLADVRQFHDVQKLINDTARARFGALKIIMDLRSAHVVTAEVSEAMNAGSHKIYGPTDRIAVITHSALLKLQLRRAFNIGVVEIFTATEDAETWLAAA